MRISDSFVLLALSLCLTARLAGQAAVEYSTATAASTTGTAAAGKGVSKSIGSVFEGLNKKLGQATGQDQPAADTKPAPVTEGRASAPSPTPAPAAKETPSRLVSSAEIREGAPRAELVRDFGKPFMKTSQTDEGVFTETYFYQGADEPVVVTLRNGKVVRVTPPPEKPPETPKVPPPGF